MYSHIEHYFEETQPLIMLRFLLENDETITIGGNSVIHVFFEFSRKFPEKITCKAMGFSGETREESEMYLKEFMGLFKKYNRL